MRHAVFLLFISFVLSSCSQNMKFSKEVWSEREKVFMIDNRRERMVDDIVDSFLRNKLIYKDVISYLGRSDRIDSIKNTISYIIYVDIKDCPMVDDSDMTFLDIKFDKDSIVSQAYVRRSTEVKQEYKF